MGLFSKKPESQPPPEPQFSEKELREIRSNAEFAHMVKSYLDPIFYPRFINDASNELYFELLKDLIEKRELIERYSTQEELSALEEQLDGTIAEVEEVLGWLKDKKSKLK
jgi:hypothetical protein